MCILLQENLILTAVWHSKISEFYLIYRHIKRDRVTSE